MRQEQTSACLQELDIQTYSRRLAQALSVLKISERPERWHRPMSRRGTLPKTILPRALAEVADRDRKLTGPVHDLLQAKA